MAEQKQEESGKKWSCGSGRCCWCSAVLIVLVLMVMSGVIGYLMGKSCAMSKCGPGMMGYHGMMGCPMMGGEKEQETPQTPPQPQAPAKK